MSINYIYHKIPKDMHGNVLFPLNVLKEIHPDLFQKEALKYVGREYIMEQKIPFLNCLWNDVLHFSAVNPSVLKNNLIEAGRTEPFNAEFFQIDPHLLNPKDTIVYLYRHSCTADKLKEDNFAKY